MERVESNKERQENELEILQAIFIDDVEDLRKNSAWKVWRPLDIVIKLLPQQSMTENKDIHVQVNLHIKCCENYPDVIPSVFITNGKGLSNTQMQDLRKQLLELANKLKGEVMILDLTQHAQKFLHDNNKKGFQSFYDEMLQNKKRQEEEIARVEQERIESEQKLLEEQRKVIQEEISRKQEELKEEFRKRKTSSSLSESSNGSYTNEKLEKNSRSKNSPSPQKENKKNRCDHSGISILSYASANHSKRTLQRGKCLGHSERGSSTSIGIDLESGEMIAIIEWAIPCSTKNSKDYAAKHSNDIHKQISSVEQEFAILSRSTSDHLNLIPYVGVNSQIERDKVLIYLFQAYVKGTTLASFLGHNIPLETNWLRYYLKSIVDVFCYLHNNDVVHKDLRATNIVIEDSGNVKICDFNLDKRLSDLYNAYLTEPVSDLYPPTLGRGSKKGDVYRFGVIALSLSLGYLVTDLGPKVPSMIPADLQDFLKNCLLPNERERWTFSQLQSHPFLKNNPTLLSLSGKQSAKDSKNCELDVVESDNLQVPSFNINFGNQSRLYNEFEVLMFLGSGGFGDVLKVRNRLDGRVYAIKRISLDPSRQQLNRKIMREVKLLSRLNHENIVRYYNSWIETSQFPADLDESSTSQSDEPSSVKLSSSQKMEIVNKNHSEDDFEKFAPPKVDISVEWSVSYEYSVAPAITDDISSSDDEDDDIYGSSLIQGTDSSESVVFEGADCTKEDAKDSGIKNSGVLDGTQDTKPKQKCLQFMYIQMEFCERSTLRMLIDNRLYEDTNLVWRLFREIIEGLVHIHQQGMIHRDLKPVNIFLDSANHIKIGDFGLATTDIISKASIPDATVNLGPNSFSSLNNSTDKSQLEMLGNDKTGRVGTALYVAPELLSGSNKIVYNQKVDIYSLGIIFFEMCYPAPSTGMERIMLLSNLRQSDVILPDNAAETMDPNQIYLIKWLLQHDLVKRPTSEELLSSDALPPPQLEEAELDEMLRHTVSNPQSKGFKRMVGALFRQNTSAAADFTYDLDAVKGAGNKYFHILNLTVETVERILKKHGAMKVTVPSLMPKCSLTEKNETNVHLMDHGGGIITLPSNLRILFARYVARRDITQMKRYSVEKIFIERKVYGCHPRECHQCVFDIVTPISDTLLPDAEVLTVANEIISEFQDLIARSYYVRINHINLLKAILASSGIPEEKHKDIFQILSNIKAKAMCKYKLHDELSNLKISEQSISSLFRYIEVEDQYIRVDQILKAITKRKGQAATLASQSLHEIQDFLKLAELLGLKLPVVISPGFIFGAPLYSGIIFQIVCELNKKDGKGKIDVLAVGGRYDKLISNFRMNPSREINQFAVGFSIDLEKIINSQLDNKEMPSLYDVVLCSVGQKQMVKEKCSVLKNLWASGIYTHVIYDSSMSLEEIGVFCKDNNVSLLLILKENDLSNVKVRVYEKDRFTEKKFPLPEIGDYVSKLVSQKSEQLENQQTTRTDLSRTGSTVDTSEKLWTSQTPLMKITFLPSEKTTLNSTKKKRLEGLILTNLSQSTCMKLISGKTCVEVLVVDLIGSVIKTISSYIELESDENTFQESLGVIIEKHPKQRKYLTRLFDAVHEFKFEKNCPVIALYSATDYVYKLLL